MKSFESFWKELQKELATPKKIKNWTERNAYFGEDFTAHIIPNPTTGGTVVCTTQKGSEQKAYFDDFSLIYSNWEGYLSGRIQRKDLREKSRVTKYTISIIHQYTK